MSFYVGTRKCLPGSYAVICPWGIGKVHQTKSDVSRSDGWLKERRSTRIETIGNASNRFVSAGTMQYMDRDDRKYSEEIDCCRNNAVHEWRRWETL